MKASGLAFGYDEVRVRIVSEDRPTLAWLESFLCPSFERLDADDVEGGEHIVRYDCDGARFAGLLQQARARVTEIRPCFALDTEVVSLPAWEQDGGTCLLDEHHGCVLIAAPGGVGLVADPASRRRRLPLLRVVREITAEAWSRRPGRLQLHAAALAAGDEAILLAGPKNAGKTTLLVHALQGADTRLIGNDRVGIQCGAQGASARGMPTVVSLRSGTLQRFPYLLDGVPAAPHPAQLDDTEWDEALERCGPFPAGECLRLSPARFCAQLRSAAVRGTRLGAILLCRIDPGVPARTIDRVTGPAAREQLAACLYGAGAGRTRATVIAQLIGPEPPGAGARDASAARLDELAARVPVFACRLGPGAYAAPADLRRELLESR